MKNLYIDFDGVILDTITTTYRLMNELNIDKDDVVSRTKFYESLNWENIMAITPEINDSINSIKKIVESNKFDVAILTHVNSLDEIVEKVKFIRKNLEHITIISVPKAISKTKMVNAHDSILIDDYSGNLREWQEAGGVGIRFSTELESKGFIVIDRLDQIIEMDL
jgi:hypothetical protein